jgi:hypothetical protein
MMTHIRKMTIEMFEVTRGNKHESKDTWWWNDDVQDMINKKNITNIYITIESDENI